MALDTPIVEQAVQQLEITLLSIKSKKPLPTCRKAAFYHFKNELTNQFIFVADVFFFIIHVQVVQKTFGAACFVSLFGGYD